VHETKRRILTATSELFRRQGYNGTSLKQVIDAAGVPFGSLYHFFPGGKAELAAEALRSSGAAYRQLFEVIADDAPDPASAVRTFFDGAALVLEGTGYEDACPIGTVALEVASTNEGLRVATAAVFEDWCEALASRLRSAGVEASDAGDLATTVVAAVEGGFMLSRAARSPRPMQAAGRSMSALVSGALDRSSTVEAGEAAAGG
jgi:AcrR family transcriptional regulator